MLFNQESHRPVETMRAKRRGGRDIHTQLCIHLYIYVLHLYILQYIYMVEFRACKGAENHPDVVFGGGPNVFNWNQTPVLLYCHMWPAG